MGGSFTENEIHQICSYCHSKPLVFVETGTYHGDSTIVASKIFPQVITFEISQTLYEGNRSKFEHIPNIQAYLGDSLVLLPTIVPSIQSGFYFLDAHQSDVDTENNGIWVPLLQELAIILKYIKKGSIIVIDDVRLFDGPWDWKGISVDTILQLCKGIETPFKDSKIANDRLIIYW